MSSFENINAAIPDPRVECIGKFRWRFKDDIEPLFVVRKKQSFPIFPCGDSANGYTVCPEIPSSVPLDEEWLVLAQIFDDTVPLADPSHFYQYAFVFDADGNPDNNYAAAPQFPNDNFQGTDLCLRVPCSLPTSRLFSWS